MGNVTANTPLEVVKGVYARLAERVDKGRTRTGRALTLAEKILFNHLQDRDSQSLERGHAEAAFYPDHVAMQDATAQMALLQFMTAGLDEVAVPATVHCDHLIQARDGAAADLERAIQANQEVYDFLRTVSARYNIGFWQPGSGIIHQVVLEQYAFPGGMIIGTDSHTPNAGGLSMVAIGVGGADAVDVLVGMPFGVRWPKLIGVRLSGSLQHWTAPKDIIAKVASLLTVSGGTGAIVEYFGPGTRTISATGKATICNMGAEIGATCSLFPYDEHSEAYLVATDRQDIAEAARGVMSNLVADPEVEENPDNYFDTVIEIDLDNLEPQIVGPHTPDRARPVSEIGVEATKEGWPTKLSYCLIGSCTNSSYEDLSKAADLARQASKAGLRVKTPLLVTPGSERVRRTVEDKGFLADLEAIGGTVLANACGPCIGQWQRTDITEGEKNSILTSYNRNFPKRNDGNAATLAFIASPETVVAYSLAGTLEFNPLTDQIDGVKLSAPSGEELPDTGFQPAQSGFIAPPQDRSTITVLVRPDSNRLQLLEPFPPFDGKDFIELPVLMKATGKCTTDHISAAGPWLAYRGHLDHISDNLFLGVNNALTGETGKGICPIHGVLEPLPEAARHCREANQRWVAIGDYNYGEGSSREHAAMEPRYMLGVAIIARSFARIHETNLKKQGILPLTFADPATYDAIGSGDRISIQGLASLAPDQPVSCRIVHPNGQVEEFTCTHTLSTEHIEWFKAGGSLNVIRARQAS